MYYSKMKSFIYDFAVMLFVIITVSVFMIYTDLVIISFQPHFLSIALIIILLAYFLQLLNQVFFMGIRAICDLLFKNFRHVKGVFVNQINYRGSAFSEKNSKYKKGEEIKRIRKYYYRIIVDCDGKKITLTSSDFLDLSQGKKYIFKIGSTSHIIVDVIE